MEIMQKHNVVTDEDMEQMQAVPAKPKTKKPIPQPIIEEEDPEEIDPDLSMGSTEVLGEHASFPEEKRSSGEIVYAQFDGKLYGFRFSSCEGRIKAAFEQWVRKNAILSIGEDCMGNSEVEKRMLEVYQEARAAGKYNWRPQDKYSLAGSAIREALSSTNGAFYLAYLLISRCKHPKETEEWLATSQYKGDITEQLAEDIFARSAAAVRFAIMYALGNSPAPDRK
jgi:hypothetical protein